MKQGDIINLIYKALSKVVGEDGFEKIKMVQIDGGDGGAAGSFKNSTSTSILIITGKKETWNIEVTKH